MLSIWSHPKFCRLVRVQCLQIPSIWTSLKSRHLVMGECCVCIYSQTRVRKQTVPVLKEKREIRWKEREEKRIKEVEQEMMARQEELKRKEEKER